MEQFESFRASSLFCKKCNAAMPVREKLLLVLPGKEIYDYLCTGCAASLGHREVTAGARPAARPKRHPRRKPAHPAHLIHKL
jgi:hypothetical protein